MNTGKLILTPVAMVTALLSMLLVPGLALADSSAQTPPPAVITAQVDKATYVVGQDSNVTVSATLPAQCAGTSATARFYTRTASDPTPIIPASDALQATGQAKVAESGAVSIAIPLPDQLPSGPEILSAGISDPSCLTGLVLVPASFQVAVADAIENPGGSGTIVIPVAALAATPNNGEGSYAEQIGSLTVFANGTKCTTVSLTSGSAIDASGNARIHVGTAEQPAVCHEANAKLAFVTANGHPLFETYTFLPGVTQVLENFAAASPASGGTPSPSPTLSTATQTPGASQSPPPGASAPLPPVTGSGAASGGTPVVWLSIIGSILLIAVSIVAAHAFYRRS